MRATTPHPWSVATPPKASPPVPRSTPTTGTPASRPACTVRLMTSASTSLSPSADVGSAAVGSTTKRATTGEPGPSGPIAALTFPGRAEATGR